MDFKLLKRRGGEGGENFMIGMKYKRYFNELYDSVVLCILKILSFLIIGNDFYM